MTTDITTPTSPPPAPAKAGREAASPGRSWAEACDQSDAVAAALRAAVDAHAHLTRERDAANARADALAADVRYLIDRYCPEAGEAASRCSCLQCTEVSRRHAEIVARAALDAAGEEPTP